MFARHAGSPQCYLFSMGQVVAEPFQAHNFEARFIGLSVFGSRNQAKDHGLRTVQRSCVPDLTSHTPWRALLLLILSCPGLRAGRHCFRSFGFLQYLIFRLLGLGEWRQPQVGTLLPGTSVRIAKCI